MVEDRLSHLRGEEEEKRTKRHSFEHSPRAILSVSAGLKAIFPVGRVEKPQRLEENKNQNAISCGQESRSLSIATDSMNIH